MKLGNWCLKCESTITSTFYQEKALVEAFSVIVNSSETFR